MSHKTLMVLLLILVSVALGCRKSQAPSGARNVAAGNLSQQDQLDVALDYLSHLEDGDPDKGILKAAYYFNRWIGEFNGEVTWQEDPLIGRLPSDMRRLPPLEELERKQYTIEDIKYLREASWMRDIAQWVTRQTAPTGFEDWLRQVEQAQGEQHAFEVASAVRLFNWTIRNIQQEALQPYPAAAAGPTPAGKERRATDRTAPPENAVPGPGYTALPWEVLQFGRGDAWQRARVFIALARQRELEAVMLAFDDPRSTPRPRPWLPAVLIDDQLYLFDTGLGLPIPGPNGTGIATLQQVRAQRALLQTLELDEKNPYPAAKADFEQLVALIDAAPEGLSWRMQAIQAQRRSGTSLVVTVPASELADRIRKAAGISHVQLWRTPLEAWQFHAAMERLAESNPELMRQKLLREWLFQGLNPLAQGRQRYFRGAFENVESRDGAKALYVKARLPDADIAEIDKTPEVQQRLGIFRGRENDQQWQITLQLHKLVAQQRKQAASYWLGLVHYDMGRYDIAQDWLKTRTLDANPDGSWVTGARYNLALTYEAQGNLKQARDLLLLDESPQRHGNLLRARQLRQRLESGEGKVHP